MLASQVMQLKVCKSNLWKQMLNAHVRSILVHLHTKVCNRGKAKLSESHFLVDTIMLFEW